MGEFKSTIIFTACLARRRNTTLSTAVPVVRPVMLHVSTLKLWLRQQWDEGCFSIGYFFQQNYPFRLLQLFVTSVTTRHAAHARTFTVSNHAALHGRSSLKEGGGEMKAEINEVSGTAQLPGHRPKEVVWGRPTVIICGEARGNLNGRNVERLQSLVTQVEERHQSTQCVFYLFLPKCA